MKTKRRQGVASGLASSLNLAALIAAFVGLAFSANQVTPERFAAQAENMVAGAGSSLSAVVPSNPYNTLAEQLKLKEDALNEREVALNGKDQALDLSMGEMLGFFSFALSIILCVLVGLNFYLDSRRGKRSGLLRNQFSVDLR